LNIYLINKSTVLSDATIQSWVPAFTKYANQVRNWWPRQAGSVIWVPKEKEPAEAWKVIFADTSDEANALGYHNYTPGGRPVSYVFAGDDIKYGYSPSATATHEIGEMIADPWISELFQVSDQYCYAKEIADPVEDDRFAYNITIPGFPAVLCSNFVLPNWFIPGATGKFDFMSHVTKPLQLLSGGYMSVLVSGKGWTQIYAETHDTTAQAVPADEEKSKSGYGRLERYGRKRGNPTGLEL
jgi:hypothetical protein